MHIMYHIHNYHMTTQRGVDLSHGEINILSMNVNLKYFLFVLNIIPYWSITFATGLYRFKRGSYNFQYALY